MDKTDFNMCGTRVFAICFDKGEPTRVFGRIFHYYRADPIPFSGPEIIFKEMEEVFDLSGFPQASSKLRSFGKKKKPKNVSLEFSKNPLVQGIIFSEILGPPKSKR